MTDSLNWALACDIVGGPEGCEGRSAAAATAASRAAVYSGFMSSVALGVASKEVSLRYEGIYALSYALPTQDQDEYQSAE